MTLMRYDRFAFLPKRCDVCGRLFWIEPYDIFYRELGIEHKSVMFVRCRECIKEKENETN